jgi:hypothetical protein
MEEKEYRNTYDAVNKRRCVFEKAINSRRCSCSKSERFHLADREGITCKSAAGNALCSGLLALMRNNARFALHLTNVHGPLPHAKEIRVQTGGMLGLQGLLYDEKKHQTDVDDIISTIDTALQRYSRLEDLPFDIIVQGIVRFEGRKRHPHRNDER